MTSHATARRPSPPTAAPAPDALFRALFVEGLAAAQCGAPADRRAQARAASPAALQAWVDETIDTLFAGHDTRRRRA